MSATIVILKKKLKRDSGKFWEKGQKLAVDLARAKQLEASGHIEPLKQPADEVKPDASKEERPGKSTTKNK